MDTLASDLNSDHRNDASCNRQQSEKLTVSLLDRLSGKYELLGSGCNAYAFSYLSAVTGLPQTDNAFTILDDSVPFLEMVLHGSVSYTGSAINYSSTVADDILKAVETGGGLYVQWIYEDNSLMKDSNFPQYYAANWKSTYDRTLEEYQTLTKALDGLGSVCIYSHCRLADNVYVTTYENGTRVIVNYRNSDYEYESTRIPAKGYRVI